ncbi:MAG: F0F1 ATP synthase subunit beta [Omnitrophica bacterium RBG_13_46_9]|nr:MAG: F0F1 ATP synthase subunit beta [Omnitrophica bacterium RBG_13_46_9]
MPVRTENEKCINGRVVAVQGPVVDVKFDKADNVPNIFSVIHTKTIDKEDVVLEVAEHLPGNIARCISINSTINIQRDEKAVVTGDSIEIPIGEALYGRIINMLGEPIDKKGDIKTLEKLPIRKKEMGSQVKKEKAERRSFEVFETGIKIIDLLFPVIKGSKTGILGGAALGKSILTLEIIQHIVKRYQGSCVFTGVGERIREGNELYFELLKHDVLSKTMMVFGQMNEPPGARFGVAMTGITMAESIQRKNQDVLLFVDNIFRFVQAGAEISTLLGRVPSETGYQPTLISEASEFHERIRSSEDVGGSVTSFEAVYVPADDLTDPAVVAIFSFLDSIMVLSREKIQLGLYPAIDPLLSSCANLDVDIVGHRHFRVAQEVIRMLQRYEELRRIVLVIGIDELSAADRILYERARKLQNFLTQPFFVAEAYTGKKGEYVTRDQTLEGCEMIISGRLDQKSEGELYLIGGVTSR